MSVDVTEGKDLKKAKTACGLSRVKVLDSSQKPLNLLHRLHEMQIISGKRNVHRKTTRREAGSQTQITQHTDSITQFTHSSLSCCYHQNWNCTLKINWIISSGGTHYKSTQSVCQHQTDIMKPKANYLVKHTGTWKINKRTLQSYSQQYGAKPIQLANARLRCISRLQLSEVAPWGIKSNRRN